MSILECRLAAEKEKDGKPFTVCEVSTWFYFGVSMLKDMPAALREEAASLYEQFGNGMDKTERGITLRGLKRMRSNGGIRIIPKTKDRFVKVKDWK